MAWQDALMWHALSLYLAQREVTNTYSAQVGLHCPRLMMRSNPNHILLSIILIRPAGMSK